MTLLNRWCVLAQSFFKKQLEKLVAKQHSWRSAGSDYHATCLLLFAFVITSCDEVGFVFDSAAVCQCSGTQAFPMGFWHCLLGEMGVIPKGGLGLFSPNDFGKSHFSVCKNYGK